jgi:hypothetical protein
MTKEQLSLIGKVTAGLTAGVLLSQFAVSAKFREGYFKRHRYKCTYPSPDHIGKIELSHRNHIKDDGERQRLGLPPYESDEAVDSFCTNHHLRYHLESAGNNGLDEHGQRCAVTSLKSQVEIYKKNGRLGFKLKFI